jgi:hypothetical protein
LYAYQRIKNVRHRSPYHHLAKGKRERGALVFIIQLYIGSKGRLQKSISAILGGKHSSQATLPNPTFYAAGAPILIPIFLIFNLLISIADMPQRIPAGIAIV